LKKEEFERRCEEMRRRSMPDSPPQLPKDPAPAHFHSGTRWSLKDAAAELGVSYWTARRIFNNENVQRYSTAGGIPVYPSTPLKRFQRVRMTYIITDSDIDRVKRKMHGAEC
jgi:hypothetical protein